MQTASLLVFFAILLLGRVQIAFALGMAALAYMLLFMPNVSLTTIPQQMFAGADSFTLTAIPFFVLVGELMSAGGISQRLVRFARALVGHTKGGMGIVALFASMIFASFSGSAVANAAGTGGITIPAMRRSGYPAGFASAIEASSSGLGSILPPSIPMIVYGGIAGVSIGGLFVAGYLPSILFAVGLLLVLRVSAVRLGIPTDPRASSKEVIASLKSALPALLTPIIIMGGILGGVMTPTESGAVGALYALVVSIVFYRELRLADVPRVLANTAVTTGMVMLVMTIAADFSWIMAFERIPGTLATLLLANLQEPWILLLVIVAFLFVIGTFVDTISAMIVLTPVLTPVAVQAGVDPLFLGIVIVCALNFAIITPPVGVVLFVTSGIAKTTVEATTRAILPFSAVLILGTFLLTFFSQPILWLPKLFGFR